MSKAAIKYQYPKLHNAMWPGLVGKGGPGDEPCIDLDTMLDLTAAAEVDGVRFDGVDIFLFEPHVSIDSSDDDLKRLADRVRKRNFVIGSLVAPVWPPTGGGSAMGLPSRDVMIQSGRIGLTPSAAMSLPVNTATTPGAALAAEMSMSEMRACECGERARGRKRRRTPNEKQDSATWRPRRRWTRPASSARQPTVLPRPSAPRPTTSASATARPTISHTRCFSIWVTVRTKP